MEKKVKKIYWLGKNLKKLEKIFSITSSPLRQNKTQFFRSILCLRWDIPRACLTLIYRHAMARITAASEACDLARYTVYSSQGEVAAPRLSLPLPQVNSRRNTRVIGCSCADGALQNRLYKQFSTYISLNINFVTKIPLTKNVKRKILYKKCFIFCKPSILSEIQAVFALTEVAFHQFLTSTSLNINVKV